MTICLKLVWNYIVSGNETDSVHEMNSRRRGVQSDESYKSPNTSSIAKNGTSYNREEMPYNQGPESRRVLLSTLKGQAETFAYGMRLFIQRDFHRFKKKMEERFGHTAMKERYVAEAKLRKRQLNESLRDFGQAIKDL